VSLPPLDDPRVREAIDDVIDRSKLVADVYPPGLATPATSLVSPEAFASECQETSSGKHALPISRGRVHLDNAHTGTPPLGGIHPYSRDSTCIYLPRSYNWHINHRNFTC
jgi:ABC-type transport system substrate-binding protein